MKSHSRQQVAQTYEAGVSGTLHHVRLLVACDDSTAGAFRVEIQAVTPSGEPGGIVLGSDSVNSLDLLPPADQDYVWHDFFPADVEQVDGTSYAKFDATQYGEVSEVSIYVPRPARRRPGELQGLPGDSRIVRAYSPGFEGNTPRIYSCLRSPELDKDTIGNGSG